MSQDVRLPHVQLRTTRLNMGERNVKREGRNGHVAARVDALNERWETIMPRDHREGKALGASGIEDPGTSDLPEQDHEVRPDRRGRREAAADKLEFSRPGIAVSGILMDSDPDLDRTSETEAELEDAVAAERDGRK